MFQHLPNEVWKDIEGYPGYQVSNMGRVSSRKARGKGAGRRPGATWLLGEEARLLTLHRASNGYLDVTLFKQGKRKTIKVHHLVLNHFVGPPPFGKDWGLHRDDNPENNTDSNLYWGTPSDNAQDCLRNGNFVDNRGSKHGNAILDEEDIPVIIQRLQEGESQWRIAEDYGVTRGAIKVIKSGRVWRHVAMDRRKLPKRADATPLRRRDNTSGYIGVTFNKQCKKWVAAVNRRGERFYLGLFADVKEAARAVNAKYQEVYPLLPLPNSGL